MSTDFHELVILKTEMRKSALSYFRQCRKIPNKKDPEEMKRWYERFGLVVKIIGPAGGSIWDC